MDLIDERNQQLKSLAMKEWNRKNNIHISNSEWYIMGLIYQSNPTISYVTKNIDITRQAVHKFARNLKSKGLVEINNCNHNNRDKCIKLTSFGIECHEKNQALKRNLEKKLAQEIGYDKLNNLKEILISNWNLKSNV